MTSNPNNFKGFPQSIISQLFSYCENLKQCTAVLQLSDTIKTSLNLVYNNRTFFKYKYQEVMKIDKLAKNEVISFDPRKYVIEQAVDYIEFLDSWKALYTLIEKDKSYNFILLDIEMIEIYINCMRGNIDELFEIKQKLNFLSKEDYSRIFPLLKKNICDIFRWNLNNFLS